MADNQVIVSGSPTYTVTVADTGAVVAVPGTSVVTVAQPIDTPTNVSVSTMGPQGPAGVSTFQTVHTYAISGTLNTIDFIPPMFFQKLTTQAATLKKLVHQISSGTSATIKLQKNGADITGYTGISVTQTKSSTVQDSTLADNDALKLVITAVSGSPQNLTATLVIEHNIS